MTEAATGISARFSIAASWALAAKLVGRHSDLTLEQVSDPVDGKALLLTSSTSRSRVALNPITGIHVVAPDLFQPLTWNQYFSSESDDAVVRDIESSAGWKVLTLSRSPRVITIIVIAQLLESLVHDDGDWYVESVRSDNTVGTSLTHFSHEVDDLAIEWQLAEVTSAPEPWPFAWVLLKNWNAKAVFTIDGHVMFRKNPEILLSSSFAARNLLLARVTGAAS
jgi:hypothetical protein